MVETVNPAAGIKFRIRYEAAIRRIQYASSVLYSWFGWARRTSGIPTSIEYSILAKHPIWMTKSCSSIQWQVVSLCVYFRFVGTLGAAGKYSLLFCHSTCLLLLRQSWPFLLPLPPHTYILAMYPSTYTREYILRLSRPWIEMAALFMS